MDRPALSSLLRGCFTEVEGSSVQCQEQEVDPSSGTLAPGVIRCQDEKDAAHRLLSAFQLTPGYHSLAWNLEQFGRYIVRVNQGREGVRGFRTELLALLGEWLATALEWATLAWPYAVFTPGANPYYTPPLPSLLTHYASIAAQRGMWGRRAVPPPPPPAPIMYGLPDAPPPIPPPPLLLRHIGPAYSQVIPMRSVAASISALSTPLSTPYQVRVPLSLCARSGPLSWFVQNLHGFPHPSVALAMTITRCHHLYCSAPGLLLKGMGAGGVKGGGGGMDEKEEKEDEKERKGGLGKGKFGAASPLHPLLNVHTALEPWRRRPRLWYDGEELIEDESSPTSSPNSSPPKGGVNPPFSPNTPGTGGTRPSTFPSTPNAFSPLPPPPINPHTASFRSPLTAAPPPAPAPAPQGFSNPSPIDEGVESNPFTLSPPSSRPTSMRITSPLASSGGGGGAPPTPNTSALAWDILNGTRRAPATTPHSKALMGGEGEWEGEASDQRLLLVPQMGLPHQATDVLREHLETRLFSIPGLSALVFHRPGMGEDWGAAWWGVHGGLQGDNGGGEVVVGGSGIEGISPPPTVRHPLVTALVGAHLQRACSITSTPTPAGKIGELVEASHVLDRALRVWTGSNGGGGEGPTTGADDLLPAMIWTLLVASPCGILETLGALEEVGREFGAGGGGQGQYVVTNWRIAVEFLRREGGGGGKAKVGSSSTRGGGKIDGGDGGMHAMAALV